MSVQQRELKKLFSLQSPRGGTHYVIEILNSFFFKLDTSRYISFILSYLDSLSTDVLLTMNDSQALVDCPLGFGESTWRHTCVIKHTSVHLQYSDTKCQLWYFLLSRILILSCFFLLMVDTLSIDLNLLIIFTPHAQQSCIPKPLDHLST